MKKLIGILLAVALIAGFGGPAFAASAVGDLADTLTAWRWNDNTEIITELDTLAIGDTAIDPFYRETGKTIGNLDQFSGATEWAEVNAAVSGYTGDLTTGAYDLYFAVDADYAGTVSVNTAGFWGFIGAMDNVSASTAYQQGTGEAPTPWLDHKAGATIPAALNQSMTTQGAVTNYYAAFLNEFQQGFVDLDELDADGVELMQVYKFSTADYGSTGTLTPVAAADGGLIQFGLDGLGNAYVTNVPVPAAVWLLGSGLLALVGIRRRNR
jgi:hypothetical protein